jgi:hypothetical protein
MGNQNIDPDLEALRKTLKELNVLYFKTDSCDEIKSNDNYQDTQPAPKAAEFKEASEELADKSVAFENRSVAKEIVLSRIIIVAVAILVGLLTVFWINHDRR